MCSHREYTSVQTVKTHVFSEPFHVSAILRVMDDFSGEAFYMSLASKQDAKDDYRSKLGHPGIKTLHTQNTAHTKQVCTLQRRI
jgi:hypothetical protein